MELSKENLMETSLMKRVRRLKPLLTKHFGFLKQEILIQGMYNSNLSQRIQGKLFYMV